MPGFVKTAADEKRWAKAKQAASGYSGDTKWKVANTIFHKMKPSTKSLNPGDSMPTTQFPKLSDYPKPYDGLPPSWYGDRFQEQTESAQWYSERGDRKNISYKPPGDKAGQGRVIVKVSQSALARK